MTDHQAIYECKLVAAGKKAYRVDEACHCLKDRPNLLYALVKAGELKLVKIAGRSLVPASEIERLTTPSDAA
ncbi:MAG: helix-turn-helix domain-containing protein [Hyphomicrobiaceae bacterium]